MNKRKKGKRIIELSSREVKIDLDKLQKEVKKAYNTMKNIVPESIEKTEIKSFGNASHIILPKKYKGKKAIIIIKK